MGWFPLGTRKQGSRPFAAPTPPNRNRAGPKAGPAHPPPSMPSHPHYRQSHGERGPSGGGRRVTSMLGSGTRMVTQQVVLLSRTSEQVDPSTTQPPPPPQPAAVSPSVLALRSEQGRDSFPRVATQPEKGRTTSSSARTKPGEGGQQGALRTSTQHGTPPSTQQQLAPMLRWSGESRNEVGGQRR